MRSTGILVLVIALCARAAADPSTADQLAEEAVAASDRGDHHAAALKFTEAYKQDPSRPALYCNIGISYFKAHELPRAHLLLSRCLERSAQKQDFIDQARAVLASVEETLRAGGHTPVTIDVHPSATSITIAELFPDEAFVGTRTVWLPFGTFHLAAHAEGYRDAAQTITTTTPDAQVVKVVLERVQVVQPPPPPKKPHATAQRSKLPAIAASAATLIAATFAAVAVIEGRSSADLAHVALDIDTFHHDQSNVKDWNSRFAIAGGLAVVGAGISSVLWYRALTRVEVGSTVAGGATVGYRVRF